MRSNLYFWNPPEVSNKQDASRRRRSIALSVGEEDVTSSKLFPARHIRITVLLVLLAVMSTTQILPASASTGNSGGAPFPYGTLGQTNNTCQTFSVNSALVLIRQPRFEQVKFTDESCLAVNNSRVLNGGLYAQINSSSAGNSGFTQGTSFSVTYRTTDTPNIWSGCCLSGDRIFFDINLYGRVAFSGGADAEIRIVAKVPGTTCAYYASNCHMWEWMGWNPYVNAPPSNVDRYFLTSGLGAGDALVNVGGPINGYYTRYYLDSAMFGYGPVEIEIDALSNSSADGAGAAADFATPGFYVAILDIGWIRQSLPAAPTIASGVGTPNGAYTTGARTCWNSVSDIAIVTGYTVQVATDSGFSHIVASQSGPDTGPGVYCYTPPPLADGQYYWRVQDNDYLGQTSPWSNTYTFYIDLTPPPAPVLSSPANNAYVSNAQPTLVWNPSTDAGPAPSGTSYYVAEISSSSSFPSTSQTQVKKLTGTSTPAPILTDGVWYWRVQAVDNLVNVGPWSTVWAFTVDTTPPSAPTLSSPANATAATSNTPTLTWSSASDNTGITSYTLQLDTSSSFNSANLISRAGITGTQFTTSVLANTLWYWRVQATDRSGNTGPWSAVWQFTAPPPPDFNMNLANSNTLWVAQGSSNKIALNLQSLYGFSGTVTITQTAGPQGATLTINPTQVTLASGGTGSSLLTISVPSNMPTGTYYFTVQGQGLGQSGTLTHTVQLNFQVIPSPITVNQSATFFGVTATVSGTFTDNTMTSSLSGTAYLTATNSTSSTTIVSNKPYAISISYSSDGNVNFVIDIAASPFWLGLACTIQVTTGSSSCSLTRTPDINHDGVINIIDLSTVSSAFGSTPGQSNWNPAADLNADGKINIIDLATVSSHFSQQTYLP